MRTPACDAISRDVRRLRTMDVSSQNEAWGYYNEMRTALGMSVTEASQQFSKMAALIARTMGASEEKAAKFLDSRAGRHLADEVGRSLTVPGWVKKQFAAFSNY